MPHFKLLSKNKESAYLLGFFTTLRRNIYTLGFFTTLRPNIYIKEREGEIGRKMREVGFRRERVEMEREREIK